MILADALKALGQLLDPRFQGVVAKGVALTLMVLAAFCAAMFGGLRWLLPDTVALPWIGPVTWLDDATSWSVLALLLIGSVVLMIPVAAAVISLFLDDVADAVEARHYPGLPAPHRIGWIAGLRDGAKFLAVVVAANLLALAGYLALPPFAPLIFVAVNGYLLGREYFQLVALRRMSPQDARAMRRRHAPTIWAAGALMAAPLAVPLLNLIVPILGAATFTHLFQRLRSRDDRTGRGRRR